MALFEAANRSFMKKPCADLSTPNIRTTRLRHQLTIYNYISIY